MKFKITYLIDVVSKRPQDYTRYSEVEAINKYEAIIQWAKTQIIENYRDEMEMELRKCKTEDELKENLLGRRIVMDISQVE